MYAYYAIPVVLLVSLDCIWSEWVDMPQFSDETRIYRTPFAKYNDFYKSNGKEISIPFGGSLSINNNRYYNVRNGTISVDEEKNYGVEKPLQDYPITRLQIVSPFPSLPKSSSNDEIEKSVDMANANESSISEITSKFSDSNNAKGNIVANKEVDSTSIQVTPHIANDLTSRSNTSPNATDNELCSNSTVQYQLSQTQKTENNMLEGKSTMLLEYLPMDVLRSVHGRLKIEPMNLGRKMVFLKAFETSLMNEIESQLATTFASGRKVRGISEHYDHSYDEHDDHGMGFPSIEGALMAISFLTFAVYLVRLVMLLFQNMNNSAATPTGTTVYLGRRKRSVDQRNFETLRLLANVENFAIKL